MPTKIEWATESWNPVTGCSPVSPGCANCYAKRMAQRLRGRFGYPADVPFWVTVHPDRLDEPLRWRKPRRVFVCSMGDLFHERVPDRVLDELFTRTVAHAPEHLFLILTKRPDRMRRYILSLLAELRLSWTTPDPDTHLDPASVDELFRTPLPNVWLGISAEDQERLDERWPYLAATPAAKRFVSFEPLLGPIDATDPLHWDPAEAALDWVIVGGETGAGARPMQPNWARLICAQCVRAGTPFFFKGWGDWAPEGQGSWGQIRVGCASIFTRELAMKKIDGVWFRRVGKKIAGARLDGKEWEEYPE